MYMAFWITCTNQPKQTNNTGILLLKYEFQIIFCVKFPFIVYLTPIQQQQKEKQSKMDSIQQDLNALETASGGMVDQFRDEYDDFESADVALQIKSEDARIKLLMAQLDQTAAEIEMKWGDNHDVTETKTGQELGITSNEESQWQSKLEDVKHEAYDKLRVANSFESQRHEFDLTNCVSVFILRNLFFFSNIFYVIRIGCRWRFCVYATDIWTLCSIHRSSTNDKQD